MFVKIFVHSNYFLIYVTIHIFKSFHTILSHYYEYT